MKEKKKAKVCVKERHNCLLKAIFCNLLLGSCTAVALYVFFLFHMCLLFLGLLDFIIRGQANLVEFGKCESK